MPASCRHSGGGSIPNLCGKVQVSLAQRRRPLVGEAWRPLPSKPLQPNRHQWQSGKHFKQPYQGLLLRLSDLALVVYIAAQESVTPALLLRCCRSSSGGKSLLPCQVMLAGTSSCATCSGMRLHTRAFWMQHQTRPAVTATAAAQHVLGHHSSKHQGPTQTQWTRAATHQHTGLRPRCSKVAGIPQHHLWRSLRSRAHSESAPLPLGLNQNPLMWPMGMQRWRIHSQPSSKSRRGSTMMEQQGTLSDQSSFSTKPSALRLRSSLWVLATSGFTASTMDAWMVGLTGSGELKGLAG